MNDKKNYDYMCGITDNDLEDIYSEPSHLHNTPVRDAGQSFADFATEKPFLSGHSKEEADKIKKQILKAGGMNDYPTPKQPE